MRLFKQALVFVVVVGFYSLSAHANNNDFDYVQLATCQSSNTFGMSIKIDYYVDQIKPGKVKGIATISYLDSQTGQTQSTVAGQYSVKSVAVELKRAAFSPDLASVMLVMRDPDASELSRNLTLSMDGSPKVIDNFTCAIAAKKI